MAEQDDQFPTLAAQASQPQGKKQQKKKAQKVSLDAFLADTTTGGSWADEMEDMPTGPSARESGADFGDRRGGPPRDDARGGGFERRDYGNERPQYESRPEVPLPTSPPYTAFVGNLSFDTSEGEIADLFGPNVDRITSIRVVTGHDGKPKGFAYVEFGSLDDLKKALALNGTAVAGRNVRVSVAEPPKRGFGDDSRASSASEWRRDGPLPSLGRDNRSSSRDYGDRQSSYVEEDPNRWTQARGSKFVPSEAAPPRSSFGGRRDFSNQSEGGERDFGSGFERGSKFTPSPSGGNTPADSRRSSYMGGPPASSLAPSEADTASAWRRAAPLPSQPTSPNPASGQSSPDSSAAPAVRKRLALAPRSASSTGAPAVSPPSATSTKPNPFGSAAPVDTAEKERAIEAKLEKLRLEAAEKAAAAPVRSSAFSSSTRSQTSNSDKDTPAPTQAKKTEPTRIMSNPHRREGFSFASAAKKDGEEPAGESKQE